MKTRKESNPPGDEPVATAIVLAAGFSSRMGAFKPLLPLGGESALERCVGLFQAVGIHDVRVVAGHRGDELALVAERLGARVVVNPRPEDGMLSSVRAGLLDLLAQSGPRQPGLPVLLVPVDIPLARPASVRRLLAAFARGGAPGAALVPTHLGTPGHPLLLGPALLAGAAAWDGAEGLRGYLRSLPHPVHEVPVADAGALADMDCPGDYAALGERLARTRDLTLPDASECLALHRLHAGEPRPGLEAHCLAVARVAARLALALREAGRRVCPERAASAALLHDLCRGEPGHPEAAARVLRAEGYSALAGAVTPHHDFDPAGHEPLGEAALVFLADKLVRGAAPVGLEERFAATRARFARDPTALAAARAVLAAVAGALGCDPEAVAREPRPDGEARLLDGFAS